jgi:hypothetical protein
MCFNKFTDNLRHSDNQQLFLWSTHNFWRKKNEQLSSKKFLTKKKEHFIFMIVGVLLNIRNWEEYNPQESLLSFAKFSNTVIDLEIDLMASYKTLPNVYAESITASSSCNNSSIWHHLFYTSPLIKFYT